MKKRWYGMIAALVLGVIGSAAFATNNQGILGEVKEILKQDYVVQLTDTQLKAKTIDELLKSLDDPHTTYMKKSVYEDFINGIENTFSGIGVYIEMEKEGIRILEPIEGSPAERVGLQKGDLIIKAKGQALEGLNSDAALALVKGKKGTYVMLTIKRGTTTFDVNVMRDEIHAPIIKSKILEGHIGYIDIDSFGSDTATDFGKAVEKLKKEKVDSWIIDLRSNGGGYLWTARAIAGYFVDTDTVVRVKNKQRETAYSGLDLGDIGQGPVVFLINEYSASASEVLTAAIKDHRKATVLGHISYGKGSVQTGYTLSNGDVLKVTIDHFYSPLGKTINKVGITPDLNTGRANALDVAALLLSGKSTDKKDISYQLGPNKLYIDDAKLQTEAGKRIYKEVFNPEPLTYKQKSEISNIQDKWWKAYGNNDKVLMEKLHDEAEKIRKSAESK